MNLIFSVFVSRPPPRCPRPPPLLFLRLPRPPFVPSPSPPGTSISIPPPARVPISLPLSFALRALSLSPSEPPPTSVRIYLSSVVRFRVIKLARAASLGFYLPEKKRINFERRRRFSAGTLFRFMCANARVRDVDRSASSSRYYLLR